MPKPFPIAVLSLLVLAGCSNLKPAAPIAARVPVRSVVHGETRVDDYRWLREKENPRVIEHLNAENAYTDAALGPTKRLQKSLYDEFLSRIDEDDTEVPHRKGDWLYYSRTQKGRDYRIFCRKPAADPAAAEQVVLDYNQFAADHEFVGRGAAEISDDGNLFAYTVDFTGFHDLHLYLKDLRTGEIRKLSDDRISSLAWAADNRTLFYCIEDDAKRPSKVLRLSVDGGSPQVVWEETDRAYNVGIGRTRSGRFIVIASASSTTSDARLIDARQPGLSPVLVAPRVEGQEYYVDDAAGAGAGTLFIRANDKGRNFRLVSAAAGSTDRAAWKEVIPHREEVMLEDLACFEGQIVLCERANGVPRLAVLDRASGITRLIPAPEAVYLTALEHNEEFAANAVRYTYESPITPTSTYDFDFATGQSTLLKRQPTPNYDASRYEVGQQFATAPDGARVPISIIRKKGLGPGPHPLWLYAYGAYGFPEFDDFAVTRFSLLDRGVIYAIAHVRGGGEMGKIWHEQGRLANKPNTFSDFIACARHLIDQRLTAPDRLAISGFSAGGLTMGAVLNQQPELFKCAIVGVPFVDVINTMLDDSLPLTTQEYLEWGDPHDPAAYATIRSYSPYDNITRRDYPAILVVTGLNDSQVMYWEPAKYVAKLRANKTDTNPLLLHCIMSGGHGGPSGRYDDLKEEALQQAFVLWQLGIER